METVRTLRAPDVGPRPGSKLAQGARWGDNGAGGGGACGSGIRQLSAGRGGGGAGTVQVLQRRILHHMGAEATRRKLPGSPTPRNPWLGAGCVWRGFKQVRWGERACCACVHPCFYVPSHGVRTQATRLQCSSVQCAGRGVERQAVLAEADCAPTQWHAHQHVMAPGHHDPHFTLLSISTPFQP